MPGFSRDPPCSCCDRGHGHFVLTDDGVYELVPATIEHHRAVGKASDVVEFPDALIAELATAAGCRHTVTLDRRAGRLPAMRVLGNSG